MTSIAFGMALISSVGAMRHLSCAVIRSRPKMVCISVLPMDMSPDRGTAPGTPTCLTMIPTHQQPLVGQVAVIRRGRVAGPGHGETAAKAEQGKHKHRVHHHPSSEADHQQYTLRGRVDTGEPASPLDSRAVLLAGAAGSRVCVRRVRIEAGLKAVSTQACVT